MCLTSALLQVLQSIEAFPVHFHIGMVNDLRAAVSDDVDMNEEKAVEKAQETLWRARLEAFQAHFNKDIALLKKAIAGHGILQDKLLFCTHAQWVLWILLCVVFLDVKCCLCGLHSWTMLDPKWQLVKHVSAAKSRLSWIAHTKRVQQVAVAQKLVQEYMNWFYPELQCEWHNVVGGAETMLQNAIPTMPPPSLASAFTADPNASRLLVAKLDLNVPVARNALVVDKYGPVVSTLARVHGMNNFLCIVVLPSRPKEDSLTDVLEDEVLITKKLQVAGLPSTLKVIQELTPAAEQQESNWLQRDTHVTYKLFFMNESLRKVFEENKWALSSVVLSAKVSAAASPPSSELFVVSGSAENSEHKERLRIVAATRAAQRGVEASEVLIKELLDGVVGTGDQVDFIDFHAHNGDFGMAISKLRMANQLKCKVRCLMLEIAGKNASNSQFAVKRTWGEQK